MTVASCPSCREDVTIPADAVPESIVQCPLCGEEFTLSDFLARLPPELIVKQAPDHGLDAAVGRPVRPPEDDHPLQLDVTPASSGVSDPQGMPSQVDSKSDPPSQFDFVDRSDSQELGQLKNSRTDKGRPTQKNHLIEFAKIAAGGLLALPLAQLILWWLPGQWQRDPFNLGPDVGRLVPWVVPQNYRSLSETAGQSASVGETADPATISEWLDAEQQSGSVISSRPYDLPSADVVGDQNPADQGGPSDTRAEGTAITRSTQTDQAVPDAAGRDASLTVKGASAFSADQVRHALENALQASVAWDTATDRSEATMEPLSRQFYSAFARLGFTMTFVRPGQPEVREQAEALHVLMRSFVRQPKKLAMIGNRSAEWLTRQDRDSNGVLLFGTVKQIELQGQLFATQLELAARQRRTVTIVSTVDPKPVYAVRSRILMLGAIIDDPQANLAGYEGDLPSVVMGAFPVPLLP